MKEDGHKNEKTIGSFGFPSTRTPSAAMIGILLLIFCLTQYGLPNCSMAAQRKAQEMCEEGIKMYEAGDIRGSFMKFREAADYDSLYGDPHYYLGLIYEKRSDYDSARKEFEEAFSSARQDPKIIKKMNEYIFIDFEKLLEADETGKAQKLLDEILENEPRNGTYMLGQARINIKAEAWDKAYKVLNEILGLASSFVIKEDDPCIPRANAYFALVNFRMQKYYDAYIHIKRALTAVKAKDEVIDNIALEVGGDGNPLVKLWKEADALYDSNKFVEAKAAYEKVLEIHRTIREVQDKRDRCVNVLKAKELLQKGKKLVDSKEWKTAKDVYNEVLALGVETPKINETIEYIDKKIYQIEHPQEKVDLSDAAFEKHLEEMQKSDMFGEVRDNFFEKYQEAQSLYEKGMIEEAKGIFLSIQIEKPDYEDVAEKVRMCDKAMDSKQFSLYALGGIGLFILIVVTSLMKVYFARLPAKRKAEALKAIEHAREGGNFKRVVKESQRVLNMMVTEKEIAKLNQGIAQAYYKLEDWDKAIEHAQTTLKIDHRNQAARTVLAKAFLEKNVTSDLAIREYKNLLPLEPGNMKLLETLAEYYVKKEMVDKDAVDVYKKLFKYQPDNFKILELIGVSYKEEGRTDAEAIAIYEEILSVEPENFEFRHVLARAYFDKELFEETIKECKFYLRVEPNDKTMNKLFQSSYIKLNKLTECIIEYERLLETHSDSKYLKRELDKLYEMRSLSGKAVDGDGEGAGGETDGRSGISMKSISVCPKCAHLNPGGASACKRCGEPILS